MIKKSVFEDELIAGMHKELIKQATQQETDNLGQAVDYLNSAIDIFEDAGMSTQASKVLKIIEKLATKKVMQMPSIKALIEKGMRPEDVKDISTNPIAKARVNKAFRALGYGDKEIAHLIGHQNLMSEKDADELTDEGRAFSKMWDWMQDPMKAEPGADLKPGDEISMKSLMASDDNDAKHKPHKPKNPTKVPDRHTKGLTSEKMVSNLKHHGTVFNLNNDGNAADDLLNADVGDLEVSEKDLHSNLQDFEDERE
jgi:hypothetical protein